MITEGTTVHLIGQMGAFCGVSGQLFDANPDKVTCAACLDKLRQSSVIPLDYLKCSHL